jgi:signal transduction histidine kinase
MTRILDHRAAPKWRPTLGMIIIAILVLVLGMPLVSLFFFRVFENHLVRQTEAELIAQSIALAAVISTDLQNSPRKTDSEGISHDFSKRYNAVIKVMEDNSPVEVQILNSKGSVIAGDGDLGLSLAHKDEISLAVKGKYASAARKGVTDNFDLRPVMNSGETRIYTAFPIVITNKVAGIIYLSQQPKSVFTALYQQRFRLGLAAIIVLFATSLMGWVLSRAIANPIRNLIAWTSHIGSGGTIDDATTRHHGTRELAQLSNSFLDMSHKLIERSNYINTFATHVSHELKSPLTSTRGAVELMLDDASPMSENRRRKFLGNILNDTKRLTLLVERLHTLAIAENISANGSCKISELVLALKEKFPSTNIDVHAGKDIQMRHISISLENAEIVFSNLIENAIAQEANRIKISIIEAGNGIIFNVSDNGEGVSSGNVGRIFEIFFTTRRDEGGTGMGLTLVKTILNAHTGRIRLLNTGSGEQGAVFEVTIPAI